MTHARHDMTRAAACGTAMPAPAHAPQGGTMPNGVGPDGAAPCATAGGAITSAHRAGGTRRTRGVARLAAIMAGCALLSGCAGPPLRLYTLGMPADQQNQPPRLSSRATTIAISRVVIPDYLDSQDMLVRRGEEIIRSSRSRWATRLSLGITDLITNEISSSHPNQLITDQPLTDVATMRVQVNISRFDVDENGQATLDANWAVLPSDPDKPLIRDRVQLHESGSISTDADVAALMRRMVIKLADQVNASLPPAH
ncbi:MAG: PqiC family protein [Acetobacter sp.]|uniref:PqiC family protein n=1 Tax=Acetobacter sp. TaxID=440 RepID=UPI0039E7FAB6